MMECLALSFNPFIMDKIQVGLIFVVSLNDRARKIEHYPLGGDSKKLMDRIQPGLC